MSRAGFSENTVALLARWGSMPVLLYIRKAPLTSSHLLAGAALAGRERVAVAGAVNPTPGTFGVAVQDAEATTCSRARRKDTSGGGTRQPVRGNLVGDRVQRRDRSAVPDLQQRLTAAEIHIDVLQRWRVSVIAALPPTPVTPAEPEDTDEVPTSRDPVSAFFPYVSSIRCKTHKVLTGSPRHPRESRTVSACRKWRTRY